MNRNIALILVKIVLTLPVTYALAYPFLNPSVAGGVFKEVEMLGLLGSVVLAAAFLAIVFLYCRDLYRSLSLVRPSARAAPPRSVWLMFLIPYNFVEDFFIIANVASSLRREAQHNIALHPFKRFGMVSGLGWCAAQIVAAKCDRLNRGSAGLAPVDRSLAIHPPSECCTYRGCSCHAS